MSSNSYEHYYSGRRTNNGRKLFQTPNNGWAFHNDNGVEASHAAGPSHNLPFETQGQYTNEYYTNPPWPGSQNPQDTHRSPMKGSVDTSFQSANGNAFAQDKGYQYYQTNSDQNNPPIYHDGYGNTQRQHTTPTTYTTYAYDTSTTFGSGWQDPVERLSAPLKRSQPDPQEAPAGKKSKTINVPCFSMNEGATTGKKSKIKQTPHPSRDEGASAGQKSKTIKIPRPKEEDATASKQSKINKGPRSIAMDEDSSSFRRTAQDIHNTIINFIPRGVQHKDMSKAYAELTRCFPQQESVSSLKGIVAEMNSKGWFCLLTATTFGADFADIQAVNATNTKCSICKARKHLKCLQVCCSIDGDGEGRVVFRRMPLDEAVLYIDEKNFFEVLCESGLSI